MLFDSEIGTLGYHYGSIQTTVSQKHFWEPLQTELGYRIISIEYMGMWPGFEHQQSRYAIQLRKVAPPSGVAPFDLTKAEELSEPHFRREVYPWIYVGCALIIACLLAALATYIFYVRKSPGRAKIEVTPYPSPRPTIDSCH